MHKTGVHIYKSLRLPQIQRRPGVYARCSCWEALQFNSWMLQDRNVTEANHASWKRTRMLSFCSGGVHWVSTIQRMSNLVHLLAKFKYTFFFFRSVTWHSTVVFPFFCRRLITKEFGELEVAAGNSLLDDFSAVPDGATEDHTEDHTNNLKQRKSVTEDQVLWSLCTCKPHHHSGYTDPNVAYNMQLFIEEVCDCSQTVLKTVAPYNYNSSSTGQWSDALLPSSV